MTENEEVTEEEEKAADGTLRSRQSKGRRGSASAASTGHWSLQDAGLAVRTALALEGKPAYHDLVQLGHRCMFFDRAIDLP